MFGATVYFGFSRHLNSQMNETLTGQARLIGNEVLVHFAARGPRYVARERKKAMNRKQMLTTSELPARMEA